MSEPPDIDVHLGGRALSVRSTEMETLDRGFVIDSSHANQRNGHDGQGSIEQAGDVTQVELLMRQFHSALGETNNTTISQVDCLCVVATKPIEGAAEISLSSCCQFNEVAIDDQASHNQLQPGFPTKGGQLLLA